MRIVFMGTPDYSVKTLEALLASENEVAAVFAQPDKPVGRKQILTPPPVKVCAENNNIPVFQPKTLRDGTAFQTLKEINPDVIVVVAYGKILPKEILELPKFGCVNGHASLLPSYRGSAPIQWSIINGDKQTGVTTMLMDEGIDTGDILETAITPIADDETAEQLFERLSVISAELMISTLDKLEKGLLVPKKQPEEDASYAPMIKKDMARLDFSKDAKQLCDSVRGFYSWPCAYFFLDGKRVKVIKAEAAFDTFDCAGTVIKSNTELVIACGGGTSLRLLEVQPEGSKPMSAAQMLCGKKIPLGTVVS